MRIRLPLLCVVALASGMLFPAPVSGGEGDGMDKIAITKFIARWGRVEANELGNAQLFTSEIMEL